MQSAPGMERTTCPETENSFPIELTFKEGC
jgi:hypothetical protein